MDSCALYAKIMYEEFMRNASIKFCWINLYPGKYCSWRTFL